MSPLYACLHLWAVTPHEWGFTDCIMSLADWVRDQTGKDPGVGFRGMYGDPAVCPKGRALLRAPFDPVAAACANAGLEQCAGPAKAGDVGLLQQAGNRFLIGGLCLGTNWASKTADRGVLIFRPLDVVAVWEVGYAQ